MKKIRNFTFALLCILAFALPARAAAAGGGDCVDPESNDCGSLYMACASECLWEGGFIYDFWCSENMYQGWVCYTCTCTFQN